MQAIQKLVLLRPTVRVAKCEEGGLAWADTFLGTVGS